MTTKQAPKGSKVENVTAPVHPKDGVHVASGHRKLEGMGATFSVLAFVAIAVGSVIEIYPTLSIHKYVDQDARIEPWTPLEQAGRDIYVKEGCYVCHSQMIRKLPFDVLRFGEASTIAESMYDRPFQWGSKRTGPDLARVGGKYPHLWHLRHMNDPRAVVPNSIMPSYPWLERKKVDFYSLRRKFSVLKTLGVPYSDEVVADADKIAEEEAMKLAEAITQELQSVNERVPKDLYNKQIVALIAYLQALGKKGGEK